MRLGSRLCLCHFRTHNSHCFWFSFITNSFFCFSNQAHLFHIKFFLYCASQYNRCGFIFLYHFKHFLNPLLLRWLLMNHNEICFIVLLSPFHRSLEWFFLGFESYFFIYKCFVFKNEKKSNKLKKKPHKAPITTSKCRFHLLVFFILHIGDKCDFVCGQCTISSVRVFLYSVLTRAVCILTKQRIL